MNDVTQSNGAKSSETAALRPLRIPQALLYFGAPAVVFSISVLGVLPLLVRKNVSPFLIFNLTFGCPNALLLAAALLAYRIEGHPFTWRAFRLRMRLRRLGSQGWLWTLLLSVCAPFAQQPFELLQPWFPRLRLYAPPAGFVSFMRLQVFSVYEPHGKFLGLSLQGRWWVIAYYFAFLIVLNVLGEELWWRGYILPRQEVAHGRHAWAFNGVLWEAFHVFLHATLFSFFIAMPGALLLAFVAQRSRSTWPGVIGHILMNYALPAAIVARVLGR